MINKQANQHGALIIDYGSQYTQLIARRIRELHVYSEICHWRQVDTEWLEKRAPACLILSGGPDSVHRDGAAQIPEAVLKSQRPVLGICYGMQALAVQLGGASESGKRHEYGHAHIHIKDPDNPLFANCESNAGGGLDVWMSHGDHVSLLPPEFKVAALSSDSVIAAMACPQRRYYGLQFHPEVVHTRQGRQILKNFVIGVAGCRPDWQIGDIEKQTIE